MRAITQIQIDGQEYNLKANQIVCFVGPNSSGKSSALEGIYNDVVKNPNSRDNAIESVNVENFQNKEEIIEALKNKVKFSGSSMQSSTLNRNWASTAVAEEIVINELLGNQKTDLNKFFFHIIDAKNRFIGIESVGNIDFLKEHPSHPLHFIYKDPNLENRLSAISESIFGIQVSLNPGAGSHLHLHIGPRIDSGDFGGNRSQEYANELAKLPHIETAGDGYKAAIGLIGQILSSEAAALFVDEPDLYLHPPQALQIAKQFCREKTDKQLFFSTHSARFAQGLFEEAADRLILIRLNKNGQSYSAKVIQSEVFSDIRNDPILKYSQISEGMFYNKTYICEDGSDCLFFQHGIEKLGVTPGESNSLWIGINGKTNFCKVAKTAKKLGISPICIADFDILCTSTPRKDVSKPLIEILSEDSGSELGARIDQVGKMIDSDSKITWENLKLLGINAVSHNLGLYSKISDLIKDLKSIGLIVIPYGEVESLHVPRLGKGIDAINAMLEKDIVNDSAMANARAFFQSAFD